MGSDLDVVVVTDAPGPAIAGVDVAQLPVPADVLVYTSRQFDELRRKGRFGRILTEEVVWVYPDAEGSRRPVAPEGAGECDRR